MNFHWLEWTNPVAIWWLFLISVSGINILMWIFSYIYLTQNRNKRMGLYIKPVLWLSALYVFGCAFRSVLPRADVQRICLFDTWFSNVLLGRFVATLAELAFIAQWAIVLNSVSKIAHSRITEKISIIIFPLIVLAEFFSWYAVISTHYLGNTMEESIWAITYFLIGLSLCSLYPKFIGAIKYFLAVSACGSFLYVIFMVTVDVPMYFYRWQNDILNNKNLLSLLEGLIDLNSKWVVVHDIQSWRTEIPWMSLYFSVAVWTSLALCFVPTSKERLSKYLYH